MDIFEAKAEFFDRVQQTSWDRNLTNNLASFLDLGNEVRLLDVGAGPGLLVRSVASRVKEAVGVDSNPALVRLAQKYAQQEGLKNTSFQKADYLSLPFPDESFDIVVSSGEVPAQVSDPKKAISEMARVTRPGGNVAIVVPSVMCSRPHALRYAREHALPQEEAELFMQMAGMDNPHTHRHFTPEALSMLCQECGLTESQLQTEIDGAILFSKGKKG
jgi:ubiquinone/menaquinone biosynthesis C-methylase UbiE